MRKNTYKLYENSEDFFSPLKILDTMNTSGVPYPMYAY